MEGNKKFTLISFIVVVVILIAVLAYVFSKNSSENITDPAINDLTNQLGNNVIARSNTDLLDGYKLYDASLYQVQYKSDWTGDVSATNPDMVVFLALDGITSINVVTEKLPMKYTAEQYTNASISSIKTTFGLKDSDISKEKTSVNGKEAYRLSYNLAITETETMLLTQTLFVSDLTAFIITYNNMGDFEDVYHNMENTFKVK